MTTPFKGWVLRAFHTIHALGAGSPAVVATPPVYVGFDMAEDGPGDADASPDHPGQPWAYYPLPIGMHASVAVDRSRGKDHVFVLLAAESAGDMAVRFKLLSEACRVYAETGVWALADWNDDDEDDPGPDDDPFAPLVDGPDFGVILPENVDRSTGVITLAFR
jgi:hypothetical protein